MSTLDTHPFQGSAFTTILVVSDLLKSKSFYIDILGAELLPREYPESVVLSFLDSWILLVLPGGPTEDKPDIQFRTQKDPDNVSHSFTIRVQNCKKFL